MQSFFTLISHSFLSFCSHSNVHLQQFLFISPLHPQLLLNPSSYSAGHIINIAKSLSDICRILSALVTLSTYLTHFSAFHIVISGSLMCHILGDALVTPHLACSLRNGQFSQRLCVLQQSCKVFNAPTISSLLILSTCLYCLYQCFVPSENFISSLCGYLQCACIL